MFGEAGDSFTEQLIHKLIQKIVTGSLQGAQRTALILVVQDIGCSTPDFKNHLVLHQHHNRPEFPT